MEVEQGLQLGDAVRPASSLTRGTPWGAERAERARRELGPTKDVLGSIIDFHNFNLDLLGFPILLAGFPRISISILSGL